MASDHEGFCVPLAEAMGHGVPIVAYGVTAVPETVGDAGLVLNDKSALPFAAAVGRVLRDATLHEVLACQAGSALPGSTSPPRPGASSLSYSRPSAPIESAARGASARHADYRRIEVLAAHGAGEGTLPKLKTPPSEATSQ